MPQNSPSSHPEPTIQQAGLEKAFFNEFMNAGPALKKGDIKLEDLIEKFKPLIETNLRSYEAAVTQIHFLKYDPEYVDKIIAIGKPFLKTKDAQAYILTTTRDIYLIPKWIEKENMEEIPDPQAFAQKIFEKVLTDATPIINSDPDLLISVLDYTAESFPDLLPKIDLTDLSGKNLEDKTFYLLAKYHRGIKLTENPEVQSIVIETATTLMLNSAETPFADIVQFKSIASVVLRAYKTRKNDELVELVLRRGQEFITEDPQTAKFIQEKIAKSGYEKK